MKCENWKGYGGKEGVYVYERVENFFKNIIRGKKIGSRSILFIKAFFFFFEETDVSSFWRDHVMPDDFFFYKNQFFFFRKKKKRFAGVAVVYTRFNDDRTKCFLFS